MTDLFSFFKKKLNIFLLSLFLLIRLVFLMTFGDYVALTPDYQIRYKILAENIINGTEYGAGADMAYPPLYPIFIALNNVLFDSHLISIKIMQILFDLGICIIIYLITYKIMNRRVALIAMTLWGIYPFAVWQTNIIGTECLFTFLLILFIHSLIVTYTKKSKVSAGLSGFFLGMAMLTRPLLTYFPIFIPIIFWKKIIDIKLATFFFLILIISYLITVSPWVLFNNYNYGEFKIGAVLEDGQGPGKFFYEGSNKDFVFAKGETRYALSDFKRDSLFSRFQNSGISKNKILINSAFQNIFKDPFLYLEIIIFKLWKLFTFTISGTYDFYIKIINIPIVIFSLYGFLSIYSKIDNFLSIIFIIAYVIAIHLLLISMFRYLVPVVPYIVIFAAIGLDKLFLNGFQNIVNIKKYEI